VIGLPVHNRGEITLEVSGCVDHPTVGADAKRDHVGRVHVELAPDPAELDAKAPSG
jgi:hypothetical protein